MVFPDNGAQEQSMHPSGEPIRPQPPIAPIAEAFGQSVGQAVRHRRAELGISMRKLAQALGCAPSYLSMIENDQRDAFSPEVLERLEWALRLRRGSLVTVSSWQATPPIVKRRVAQMESEREAARRLAQALKGQGLDALYRSGDLRKLVQAIAPDDPALPPDDGPGAKPAANTESGPDAARDSIRDERPSAAPERARDGAEPPSVALIRGLPTQVPLINKVSAGYPSEFTDLGYPARVADEYVTVPEVSDPDAFAARVVGDSMEPVYHEGDIVVFSPSQAIASGADCFVRLERDEQTTFKRVFFENGGDGAQFIRLQPLNSSYAPRVLPREDVAGLYAAVYVVRRIGAV